VLGSDVDALNRHLFMHCKGPVVTQSGSGTTDIPRLFGAN